MSLAVVALAGTVGMISLVRGVGELGPKVGDIVAFEPLAQLSRDMKAQIAVMPATGARPIACTLDVRAMHAGGGSVVIEAAEQQTPRTFRVHWAGVRTSYDAADCGVSADFVLDQEDLSILAMAAGGYGVAAKKLESSSLSRSADASAQ